MQSEPDRCHQALDEAHILLMFRGQRPNLQDSFIESDTQMMSFANPLEEAFVFIPADVATGHHCVCRQLGDDVVTTQSQPAYVRDVHSYTMGGRSSLQRAIPS